MQVGTGATKMLLGYNGFPGSSTEIKLPLVMANNYGYYTGIQVMNLGAAPTNVTIDYTTNIVGSFNPVNDTTPCLTGLAQNQSCTVLQRNGQFGTYEDATKRYIGSAIITNSAGNNLVAITNQTCFKGKAGCPNADVGSAYEGFNAASATKLISVPLVMANNYKYYTGIQVQNVGTGSCDAVTVTYSANTYPGSAFAPVPEQTTNLASGSSFTFLQRKDSPTNQWGVYPDNTKSYVGSADIVSTGTNCLIAAIVNEQNPPALGDQFMTYNGTNY